MSVIGDVSKPDVTNTIASDASKRIVETLDKVSEDQTPFIKQEGKDIAVVGDPTIVDTENKKVYSVRIVLPRDEFETSDFNPEVITDDTHEDFFTITIKATQEKVTPNRRGFYMVTIMSIIGLFFEKKGNKYELITPEELPNASLEFYQNDILVGAVKNFLGALLAIDKELVPYIHETDSVSVALDLLANNPGLINEAYFTQD